MARYLFTFEPKDSAKIIIQKDGAEAELFYSVYASKYPIALRKLLKMELPNISSEEDLLLTSVQEELDIDDEDRVTEQN